MPDSDHKRLLEMAAKAFWGDEIDDVVSVEWSEQDNSILYTHADNQDHNGLDRTYRWNPLADDGDALRLAVKLRLEFEWWKNGVSVNRDDLPPMPIEYIGSDPTATTRTAIVRAAAAIGEQKP